MTEELVAGEHPRGAAPRPRDVAELEAHLRDHVPATHIPVVWRFVDALPRTAMSFKVDRPAVRKLLEDAD